MARSSTAWLKSEADAWHRRNHKKVETNIEHDKVIAAIRRADLHPKTVFEVGCGSGARLARMRDTMGCEVWGCDVSTQAIAHGIKQYNIKIGWREAKNLRSIPKEGFDMVIYGFCLYAIDAEDLFAIVQQGDRILKNGGHMVVYDFSPVIPHSRVYGHDPSLRVNKMRYSNLWLAHPAYKVVYDDLSSHEEGEEISEDTAVSVTIMSKHMDTAFPLRED